MKHLNPLSFWQVLRSNYKLFLPSFMVIAVLSCTKKQDFPDEPVLSNLRIMVNSDSTANILVDFTDGDGDIGLRPQDTTGVYNPDTGIYKFNLIIDYYENQNGTWVKPREDVFSARISDLGGSGPLQGTIDRLIGDGLTYFDPVSPNLQFRYEVQLVDRSLNTSNRLTSDILVKP